MVWSPSLSTATPSANVPYWWWASRLAAPTTLFLPVLAAWPFLDHSLPASVWKFRVLLSLGAIVVFGFVGIVKQARLERELAHANDELLDASLTDLLTGVRNRRFFANSIQAEGAAGPALVCGQRSPRPSQSRSGFLFDRYRPLQAGQ